MGPQDVPGYRDGMLAVDHIDRQGPQVILFAGALGPHQRDRPRAGSPHGLSRPLQQSLAGGELAPAHLWVPTSCAPTAAAWRSSALPPAPEPAPKNQCVRHRHTAAPAAGGAACAGCGDS